MTFLSFGLLRPVVVMLTASNVHAFVSQQGMLFRDREGWQVAEAVEIQRHHADLLSGSTNFNHPLTLHQMET